MAAIDCSLDLTRALVAKNVWSFPAIGAWTSLHKFIVLINILIDMIINKALCGIICG
jgi:hypothetical protein